MLVAIGIVVMGALIGYGWLGLLITEVSADITTGATWTVDLDLGLRLAFMDAAALLAAATYDLSVFTFIANPIAANRA